MKFAHISDLHIGKRVNEFSMLEDQKYILDKILEIIDQEKVQGVLIAGDVFDKTMPSAEAVALCDEFLTRLSRMNLQTYMISGNHDCAERVAFGARIMEQLNIHISPVFDGVLKPITMKVDETCVNADDSDLVDIYLLPFVKPATVRRFYPEDEIASYTDAVRVILEHTDINLEHRNILVAHQFVTGATRCESEEIMVGGVDNVDAQVFDAFDYVALGHIHGPQKVLRDTIRYCGTPLKYSFSEVNHKKSVTIIELDAELEQESVIDTNEEPDFTTGKRQNIQISTVPLKPLRDLREIKGSYEEITLRENYICTNTNDYLHITLTDEEDIPDAIGKLRAIYPNIMKLDYDNKRTRTRQDIVLAEQVETKSPIDLFEDFYYMQNNQKMSEDQIELVTQLVEGIWE